MKKISTLEKKLNASAFAFVVAMAATSYSHAHTAHHGHGAYVGLDAVYNWMGFKKDYGQNIFKKQAPGVNVFAGYMFHENFGAEVGFEWDKKSTKKDVTVVSGDKVGGQAVLTNWGSATYKSELKQTHPYLGLIAKTNILDNTSVGLMLGGSLSSLKEKYTITSLGNGATAYNGQTSTFSKTKLIPIVKVFVGHKITNDVCLRALVSWKNTSSIKAKDKEARGAELRPKDIFSVGIGVAYHF